MTQNFIKNSLLFSLRLYQIILSPLWGPCCRFTPSCSRYTHEAIVHYGVAKGIKLGFKRLLRCHPWHPGGYDPPVRFPFN